jgi:hypothetical protein
VGEDIQELRALGFTTLEIVRILNLTYSPPRFKAVDDAVVDTAPSQAQ